MPDITACAEKRRIVACGVDSAKEEQFGFRCAFHAVTRSLRED